MGAAGIGTALGTDAVRFWPILRTSNGTAVARRGRIIEGKQVSGRQDLDFGAPRRLTVRFTVELRVHRHRRPALHVLLATTMRMLREFPCMWVARASVVSRINFWVGIGKPYGMDSKDGFLSGLSGRWSQ